MLERVNAMLKKEGYPGQANYGPFAGLSCVRLLILRDLLSLNKEEVRPARRGTFLNSDA